MKNNQGRINMACSIKMKKTIITLPPLISFTSFSAFSSPILKNIEVNTANSNGTDLVFSFSESPVNFTDNLKYNPNRLEVNFEAASALNKNQLSINTPSINSIDIQPLASSTKTTISLVRLTPYKISKDGNNVHIIIPNDNKNITSPSPTKQNIVKSETSLTSGSINKIKSIDFHLGKSNQAQVLVNLQNSTAAVEVSQRGNHIIATFNATDVVDEQAVLHDVNDFKSLVDTINVTKSANSSIVDIKVKDALFDYKYDQSGNIFVIEVSKKPVAKDTGIVAKKYAGKPMSLNFQNVPVRTVLQLIADFNKLNLVTSDTVAGNITLRLDGVPWDQALDTVLKVKGLDKRLDGNILLVAPAAEIANQENQQLENKQKVSNLAPLVTEYVQINYAKAADMAKLLADNKTRLLSPRGAVSVDDRTNTILIKDTAETIDHIKDMIKVLDVAVKQVVIEARMVTVTDGAEQAIGVQWGVSNDKTSGTLSALDSINAGTATTYSKRLNVNLASSTSSGNTAGVAFQLGTIDGSLLDLQLNALETENKAEIISSPRVTTANQKEALIEQGYEIPYSESSSSGASTISFKKAVLSLKVTPQITPDNNVILDLHVTQDDIYQNVQTGTGTAVALSTQAINTQVLVKNGQTLVLGGIFTRSIKKTVDKVPVLGDLPGVGALFRNSNTTNSKKELLIFVTPKIVANSLGS